MLATHNNVTLLNVTAIRKLIRVQADIATLNVQQLHHGEQHG